MRTPLTLLNLLHQPVRTLWALAGVSVAAIMLLMQLGFRDAVKATATLLYDQLDFDVLLVSKEYIDLNRPRAFPPAYLQQALGVSGVRSAVPVRVGFNLWKDPADEERWRANPDPDAVVQRWSILIVAVDPADPVFRASDDAPPELATAPRPAELRRLLQPDTVLIDRKSRREFGPQTEGAIRTVGEHRVTIAGTFEIGTGFGANGLIVTSPPTFARIMAPVPTEEVNLGLVKLDLAHQGQAAQVAARLNEQLPADVQALTRAEITEREQVTWIRATSMGVIFTVGVGVALLVGVVFVVQVMASDIDSRMAEYATLKALGYGMGYLRRAVMKQAFLLALLGFAIGFAVAAVLYALTQRALSIPIAMTWDKPAAVFLAILAMCLGSGLWVLDRLNKADPADLF
jgi:putative ABC transport system permease protein